MKALLLVIFIIFNLLPIYLGSSLAGDKNQREISGSKMDNEQDTIKESILFTSFNEYSVINISKLRSLLNRAADITVNEKGEPVLSDIFIAGSLFYLQKDGMIQLDKVGDIDIYLVIRNASRSKVEDMFKKNIKEVLKNSGIHYISRYECKKTLFRKSEIIYLITPSDRQVCLDVSIFTSAESIKSLLAGVAKDFLLDTSKDKFLIEDDQRYIKKYILTEFLAGNPEIYQKYKDRFLKARVDEYKDIRSDIDRSGRIERLKIEFNEKKVIQRFGALSDSIIK